MEEKKRSKSWFTWVSAMAVLIVVMGVIISSTAWGSGMLRQGRTLYYELMPQAGTEAMYVRQLITPDMTHSRIIMWETHAPEADPVVLYKIAGASDSTIETVPATMERFEEDKTVRYIYRAELTGLTPNSTYEYQVGKNVITKGWHTLHTMDESSFTALIFPDSQSSDYSGWQSLVNTAYKENPEATFFVNMGDLVDNGESAYQWDAWFGAVEPMIANIPFVGVSGNHEYYSLDWQIKEPTAYDHFFKFDAPKAEPYSEAAGDSSRRAFYSYDYGDVHFVVLNTQFNEMNESYRDEVRNEQMAWLEEDLAATTKPWKVVLMHRDTFSYPNTKVARMTAGFSDIGELFMPVFEKYNVDMVLSAHYHMYRRRGHVENFQRSENGPYYIITGVAGDVKYVEIWKDHSLDEYVSPYLDGDNYLVLRKDNNSLTVDAYLADGTKFDSITLRK